MSERGVFAVDRGIWDHPGFAPEPFTEREAWQWMIGEAAYKPHRRRVGSVTVELERGQLAHSLRFMADKWKWSEPRVRRFLGRRKIDAALITQADAGVTVITICNYDRYQKVSLPSDAANDARSDASATQQRRKVEDKENKEEEDSEANASAAVAAPLPAPIYTDSRHELWGEGTAILTALGVAEKSARSNIGRWLRDSRDDAATVLGAIQRARDHRIVDPIPWITRALRSPVKPGTPNANPQSVIAAADRLVERIADFQRPAERQLCGGAGSADVRLLPPRRGE